MGKRVTKQKNYEGGRCWVKGMGALKREAVTPLKTINRCYIDELYFSETGYGVLIESFTINNLFPNFDQIQNTDNNYRN